MRRVTLAGLLALVVPLGARAQLERPSQREEGPHVQVLTRRELAQVPARSLADALRILRGLDVRRRGPEGLPASLSLGGAGADGTLLVVDGEVVNDPASGDFSADLDLPLEAVERIEIREGGASAVWGPGALGGVISVTTRGARLGRANAQCETRYGHGSHALDSGSYRGAMAITARSAVAFDYARAESSGFGPGTDLSTKLGRLGARLETGRLVTSMSLGYGGWSHGPQTTRTRTARAAATLSTAGVTLDSAVFLRDHDAGLGTETFGSTVAGVRMHAGKALLGGQALLGMELVRESFRAPDGGPHRRDRHSVLAELARPFSKVSPGAGGARLALRFDHDDPGGSRLSPQLSLWTSPGKRLVLHASAGTSYRLPSFTELHGGELPGNPDLRRERATHLEAGASVPAGPLLIHARLERRFSRDVLTRASDSGRPLNVARASTTSLGGSVELDRRTLGTSRISRLGFAVSYLHGGPAPASTALAPLRLKWDFLAGALLPGGVTAFTRLGLLSYRDPARDADPLIWDVRLGRQLLEGEILEVYAELQNALDEAYQERPGVPLPGRTLFAGFQLTW